MKGQSLCATSPSSSSGNVGPSSSPSTSHTQSNSEEVRQKSELLREVVEKAVRGSVLPQDLRARCIELGATLNKVGDVLDEVQQRRHIQFEKAKELDDKHDEAESVGPRSSLEHSPHPENGGDAEDGLLLQDLRDTQQRAEEELRWKLLEAKLRPLYGVDREDASLSHLMDVLGKTSDEHLTSIPPAVLAVAPHLAHLNTVTVDTYIQKTITIKELFGNEKYLSAVLDKVILHTMPDPFPRSLWKDILQDKYVDFEKLHASLDPSYDRHDDIKEFPGGWAFVKKDQYTARKKVTTQAQWTRVFHAWSTGVKCILPSPH